MNRKHLFHSRYEKIKSVLRDPSEQNILMNITRRMDGNDLSDLFIQPVSTLPSAFDSKELQKEFSSTLPFIMAIDYQTYLLDDILQKVDRATMSVSLEGREPFLDQRIIEWAARLPTEYKYNNGNKKFILKQIVHKYLPKEMMDRPKMGFGIPVASWLQNDLRPLVDQFLDNNFIVKQNIFVPREIQRIKDSFHHGRIEVAEKIWFLLMFQMWYDRWINNN